MLCTQWISLDVPEWPAEGPPLCETPAPQSVCLQKGELISEFVLKGYRVPAGWLFICEGEEKDSGGEGQEEASRVAVMAFQGKLRHRELFGFAFAEGWPLFPQVARASSPSPSRHNSFSSQSASEHRLSDCHCPWFITPVPATGAECHQASATLAESLHVTRTSCWAAAVCGGLTFWSKAKQHMKVMVRQDPSLSILFDCNRLVQLHASM